MALWGPDNPLYSRSSYNIFSGEGGSGVRWGGGGKGEKKTL